MSVARMFQACTILRCILVNFHVLAYLRVECACQKAGQSLIGGAQQSESREDVAIKTRCSAMQCRLDDPGYKSQIPLH